MVVLLFGDGQKWYGEAHLFHGSLRQMTLTPEGERSIGPSVGLWQTKGIPCRHEMQTVDDGSSQHAFFIEHVPMRDAESGKAIERWASDRGISLVMFADDRLRVWESLLQLPLHPAERFAFAVALRETPTDLLPEWSAALEVAMKELREEKPRKESSAALKRRVGKRLLSPFQRAKQKQK